jgi:5'-3' exonuclease
MIKIEINLYSFAELGEKAKKKAIRNHKDFMLSRAEVIEDDDGGLITHYYDEDDLDDHDVIDEIEANEYLFFEDGGLAHCTTYTGKHEKAGITEFHFKGRTIDITALLNKST